MSTLQLPQTTALAGCLPAPSTPPPKHVTMSLGEPAYGGDIVEETPRQGPENPGRWG